MKFCILVVGTEYMNNNEKNIILFLKFVTFDHKVALSHWIPMGIGVSHWFWLFSHGRIFIINQDEDFFTQSYLKNIFFTIFTFIFFYIHYILFTNS